MEIFLQMGLGKRPDGQITRRRREQILSCPGRGAAFSRRGGTWRDLNWRRKAIERYLDIFAVGM